MNTKSCPCQHQRNLNLCKQCCYREERIDLEILGIYYFCRFNGIKISKKKASLIFTDLNQKFNLL